MVLLRVATVLHEVVTAPEVVMARREVDTVLEEATAVVRHLLVGTAEEEAVMVLPLAWVLDPEARLPLVMLPILTTALKAVALTCSDHHQAKNNLLPEALRLLMTWLLARPSRWMNVPAAHPALFLSKLRLMV